MHLSTSAVPDGVKDMESKSTEKFTEVRHVKPFLKMDWVADSCPMQAVLSPPHHQPGSPFLYSTGTPSPKSTLSSPTSDASQENFNFYNVDVQRDRNVFQFDEKFMHNNPMTIKDYNPTDAAIFPLDLCEMMDNLDLCGDPYKKAPDSVLMYDSMPHMPSYPDFITQQYKFYLEKLTELRTSPESRVGPPCYPIGKYSSCQTPDRDRNAFEFHCDPSYPTKSPPPSLSLYPRCATNYLDTDVAFIIQVFNIPPGVTLSASMFEAYVQPPQGPMMPCKLEPNDGFIPNSFIGYFKPTEPAGIHVVTVGLVLTVNPLVQPEKQMMPDEKAVARVFEAVAHIPVSRNYFRDSQQESLELRCVYKLPEYKQRNFRTQVAPGAPIPAPSQVPDVSNLTYNEGHQFAKLWGLTCDFSTNNLYYTDRGSHKVYCISPNGMIINSFGQNVSAGDKLVRPAGIACDNFNRRLVIADKDNHRVSFFTLDGLFISSFGCRGHKNGMFLYPWGVAVSPGGAYIAVADSRNKRIQLFDRYGNFLNKYSVYETTPFEYKTEFDYPRGVTFDQTGQNIYVTDFNVQNVLQLPLELTKHRKIVPEGRLNRPQGLVVDNTGNLLVADSRNDIVRHLTPEGDLLASIHNMQKCRVEFPINLTVMAGGFIALLDGFGKIHVF